jgi:hypothetical protein
MYYFCLVLLLEFIQKPPWQKQLIVKGRFGAALKCGHAANHVATASECDGKRKKNSYRSTGAGGYGNFSVNALRLPKTFDVSGF